jgi:hypothetical protein
MANSGCFITSFTQALPNWAVLNDDGTSLTPGQVLDRLIAVNGLSIDGQLSYDGVMRAFPSLYFHDRLYTTNCPGKNTLLTQTDAVIAKVRRLLDCGQPTILAVDNLNADGIPDHSVLACDYLTGPDGKVTDFRLHDPDGGRDILFSSRYGDIRTKLYGAVIIIGPPVAFPDQSTDKEDGVALWKATQIRRGINVATYAKELIDTLL